VLIGVWCGVVLVTLLVTVLRVRVGRLGVAGSSQLLSLVENNMSWEGG